MGKFRIVIKCVLFYSWYENYLRNINTGDIFEAIMTEKKFAKSRRYKIKGKHFHPKNYIV